MGALSPKEVHFCTDGQTDVVLDTPYIVGADELSIYLNGMMAVAGQDYDEIDAVTIRFRYQLSSEDIIIGQHHVLLDGRNITVIDDTDNSLFKKYGEIVTLLENQKYVLSFKQGEQSFDSTFYTRLNPFYSTLKIIRADLGTVIDDVPDDRLVYLIFDNSILSQNIASEENLGLLESENKTPYVFKQFVRYRTELDLMMAVYLLLSGRQGSQSRILGELEILSRSDFGSMDIGKILGDLKMKLRQWEKLLRGSSVSSPVRGAVRGGSSSPYPLTSPRRTNSDGVSG